jgi:hypothetical protein
LRGEIIHLETFLPEEAVDGDDLIGIITAENFEASKRAVEGSLHGIDTYHKRFQADS